MRTIHPSLRTAFRIAFFLIVGHESAATIAAEFDRRTSPGDVLVIAAAKADVDTVFSTLSDGIDANHRLTDNVFFQHDGKRYFVPARCNALLAAVTSNHPALDSPSRHSLTSRDDDVISTRRRIVDLLLQKGADAECSDRFGDSVLINAIRTGRSAIAIALIDAGANVNRLTSDGFDSLPDRTPLHLAVRQPAVIDKLLESGADLSIRTPTGLTALDIAEALGEDSPSASIIRTHIKDTLNLPVETFVTEPTVDENAKIEMIADMLVRRHGIARSEAETYARKAIESEKEEGRAGRDD